MKRIAALILCLISVTALNAQFQNATITHDGMARDYFYYLPSNHNAANKYPLVFNLHGRGSNAGQQQFLSDMTSVAEANGFIVINPNAISNEWNLLVGVGNDDLGFISALLDLFVNDFGVDPDRVYSMGMSLGGFMSYNIACEMTDKFAAIASVTGTMAAPTFNNCQPSKAIPVMQMHGTADPVVSYTGAPEFAPIEDVIDFWVNHNNCPTTPSIDTIPDIDTNDSCSAVKYTYSWGTDSTQVIFYRIDSGGHTWPGGPTLLGIGLGKTNQDYSASEVIWQFFDDYDINGRRDKTATSIGNSLQSNQVFSYPNPFYGQIALRDLEIGSSLSLFSVAGKIVIRAYVSQENQTIDTEKLPTGTYFLVIENNNGSSVQKLVKAR